jgi:anaerobic magnesium-protoporphyrin IX monomethyl ester cyclase
MTDAMTDVLLAHSYFLCYDIKQTQKMKPYPPLATLIAAAVLREAGHSVALFDAMLAGGEHEFEEALARHHPKIVVLFEDNFNFLSKMCLSRMRDAAGQMIAMARRTGALVIAAGSDVTDHPETFLRFGAHLALLGEGDHTLKELLKEIGRIERLEIGDWRLRKVSNLQSLISIPGIAYLDHDSVKVTQKRQPERQPDVFPFAAWDLLDVEAYRQAWTAAHGYFSLNMASTRGCPFHCNWCAKPIWGQRYAMRTPAHVAEELALVKRTLRPDHIWFADDIFGLRPQWVAEFGRAVVQRDAAIPFTIQSRVDLMTDEAIDGLKQAGCAEVWLGAESGSQKILDAMDKGTQVEDILTARAKLKAAGIRACFFIQLGYPGETWDDILLTLNMVRQAVPDNIGVSVSYPLPGTKFHDMVKAQLGDKDHWTDSDDLAMMFRGTYQTPFYKKLHSVLHLELEVKQGLEISQAEHGRDCRLNPISNLQSLIPNLQSEWAELVQLEQTCRNDAPTQIVKPYAQPITPDLSGAWN